MGKTFRRAVIWVAAAATILAFSFLIDSIARTAAPAGKMSWIEFLAAVVSSTAWPALILVVICMFRTQAAVVLTNLVRIKFPGGEIEVGPRLNLVNAVIKPEPDAAIAAIVEGDAAEGPLDEPINEPIDAAKVRSSSEYWLLHRREDEHLQYLAPSELMWSAWQDIVDVIREITNRHDPQKSRANMPTLLSAFRETEIPTDVEMLSISELQSVRNDVEHRPDCLSANEARTYRLLANTLVRNWRIRDSHKIEATK